MGLPTWDKQSFACLSSRFVYGETISEEKLGMVDKAEQLLLDMGFHQVRVRIHGDIARIEVLPDEIAKLVEGENRKKIYSYLKQLAQRWLFSSAPLYADNTLAHHITKCKYYVIHFVLSYYFSVNIMGE